MIYQLAIELFLCRVRRVVKRPPHIDVHLYVKGDPVKHQFSYVTTIDGYHIYKCACGATRKIKVR